MAKFKRADYKKQHSFYSIVGKIGDILFYPVIVLTLLAVFAIYSAKSEHQVPAILGVSLVSISSGSMTKAGFEIHDVVFLHKENASNLRAGDIIAFYYQPSGVTQNSPNLTKIQTYDMATKKTTKFNSSSFKNLRKNERTLQTANISAISNKTDIYFHRIIGIFMAEDGTIFYQTEGDSNHGREGPESYLTPESLVVGEYTYTPKLLREAFQFASTTNGIIILVLAPLCILCLFMLFSIIEQISRMSLEKKVLTRAIRYDDPESLKANIGIEMELYDKAKFYATTEDKEKPKVAEFLWGYMNDHQEKNQQEFHRIMHSLEYLKNEPQKYWMFFLGSTKSKFQKKKIYQTWKQWTVEERMKEKFEYVKKQKQKKKNEKISTPPKRPQRLITEVKQDGKETSKNSIESKKPTVKAKKEQKKEK